MSCLQVGKAIKELLAKENITNNKFNNFYFIIFK